MISTEEDNRFFRRDFLGQASRLELNANYVAKSAGVAGWIDACHAQCAAVWLAKTLQTFQCAGLTSTIGSKQPEDFTRHNIEADILYSNKAPVGFPKVSYLNCCGIR